MNPEKITPNDYSEIELTEEEKAEALRAAREKKAAAIEAKKYWEKVTAQQTYMKYSAIELYYKLVQSRNAHGKPFIVDDDNREQVKRLCVYFACDEERASQMGIDLTKGLLLMGNVGVGKTHLMSFFFQNQNASYVMVNCRTVEDKWINQDKGTIDYYSNAHPYAVNADPFGHNMFGMCFDDLGTENSPSKAYGEEKNVLADIIMNRYENRLPYNMTHFTTNLSAHDLGLKYGTRVRDRMREMCNQIQFDNGAKSRR